MKKILIAVIAILAVGVGAYFVSTTLKPESEKITKKIQKQIEGIDRAKFLSDPVYRIQTESNISTLEFNLANARTIEGRPDEAIRILEGLIKKSQNASADILLFNKNYQSHSSTYGYEALLFGALANAYDLKKDDESAKKARAKAIGLEKQAETQRKVERAEEEKKSAKLLE